MSPAPAKAAAPAHRPAVTRSAPPAPGPIRTRARPVGLGNTVSLAMAQRAPGGAAPGAGNAAMVQAHRTVPVSAHDDPAEREAERVARRVVETMQSTLVVTEAPRVIARLPTGAPPFGAPSEAGMAAASSGGTPLPPGTRRFMESRFDADFGDIRVHEDERAAKLADGMGARAFAYGKHLFFARGQYRPDSADGAELIAHELTHTIQQGAAPQHAAPAQPQAPRVQRANVLGFELTLSPLDWAAKQANLLPGFPLLTLILGLNPINGAKVDRSPANLIRAVITLMPGGALIVQALDRYGIIDKVGGWISAQIDTLKLAGAAIAGAFTAALKSIDLTDPSGSWERVKRIFTEPIDRIKQFIHGLVDGVIQFVRDAVLRPLVGLAAKTKGWDLLIAVLGRNPITGEPVPQTADTLVGGFMKLIGQEEIWENIKKANAIARVMAWYQKSKAELLNFVQQFPTLFLNTLKSFKIEDLLDLTAAFGRVAASFGDFAGRFFTWAGAAMWSILEIVFEVVSPAALGYIKKAGAAFKDILKNPLGFVGNLVKAAKLGLTNFADNLVEHLKAGLIDWLTGSLPGVYIPKALSLGELGKFALSVLGISWGQVRGKIVKALGAAGETIMKGLETTYDVVIALVKGGAAAVWELIKEKLTDLKDTVLQGIIGFVVDAVVKKAIPKLVAMFIPGAGFISAIISIYDTIMVFVEKLSKIAAAVKAFVDSIIAIAQGQIGGAAKKVESTLAGLLSLAISFLAGFAGLGKVADKIKEVIQKVWATVDKAVEAAVGWVVGKAKALFARLFSRKEPVDPAKAAKLQAAFAELGAIEGKHAKAGRLTRDGAEAVATEMAGRFKVFSRFFVHSKGERWNYGYAASPEDDQSGTVPAQGQLTPEQITKCKVDAVDEIVHDSSMPIGQIVETFLSKGMLGEGEQVKLASGQEMVAFATATRMQMQAGQIGPKRFSVVLGNPDITPQNARKGTDYSTSVNEKYYERGFGQAGVATRNVKASVGPSKYTEMRGELQATAGSFGLSAADLLQGVAHYSKTFDLSGPLKAKVTSKAQGEQLLAALSRLTAVYLSEMIRQDTSVSDVASVTQAAVEQTRPSAETPGDGERLARGTELLTAAAPFTQAKPPGGYSTQELALMTAKQAGTPLSDVESKKLGGDDRRRRIAASPEFHAYLERIANLAERDLKDHPNKDTILGSAEQLKAHLKSRIKAAFGIG